MSSFRVLVAVLPFLLPAATYAATLDAVNFGHFRSDGRHSTTNFSTITGLLTPNPPYRSFFVFDLDTLAGTVQDATLRLELENYNSFDGSQAIDIFDVATDPADLDSSYDEGSIPGQAIYADCGSGNTYAGFNVVASQVGTIIEIPLNAQGVADIQAQLGNSFAVALVQQEPFSTPNDYIRFSDSEDLSRTHQLVLTIALLEPPGNSPLPEPGTLALLAAELCCCGMSRRRSRLPR